MTRLILSAALLSLSACSVLYIPSERVSSDGGEDAGFEPDAGQEPDAGFDLDAGLPPEAVTPAACPVRITGACLAEKVVCSWDSTQLEQLSSLRSNIFQVKGLSQVESTQGGELVATFEAPMVGTPVMVGFSVRRNSSVVEGTPHKLLVDIIPMDEDGTTPLIPSSGESPIASISYDTSNARIDADTPVTLTFNGGAATKLAEGQLYGLYFHLESSSVDDIGLVGLDSLTDETSTVFLRSSSLEENAEVTHSPWVIATQKSLNFFVTVGGPIGGCTNPFALQPVNQFPASCWTRMPGLCPDVNSVWGICSVNPNSEPNEPIWPSLFPVIGPAMDGGSVQLAVAFSGMRGVPLSAQIVVRRLSSATSPESHELIAEILPVEELSDPTRILHFLGPSVATAHLDLSNIGYNPTTPHDERISLNFKSTPGGFLNPSQTYALTIRLSEGSLDRLGAAGAEVDLLQGINVYTRMFGLDGNGLWSRVANRELDFSLVVADTCEH